MRPSVKDQTLRHLTIMAVLLRSTLTVTKTALAPTRAPRTLKHLREVKRSYMLRNTGAKSSLKNTLSSTGRSKAGAWKSLTRRKQNWTLPQIATRTLTSKTPAPRSSTCAPHRLTSALMASLTRTIIPQVSTHLTRARLPSSRDAWPILPKTNGWTNPLVRQSLARVLGSLSAPFVLRKTTRLAI